MLGLLLTGRGDPPESLVNDCRALTQSPHRLTGSAEYRQAADHVETQLKELGLQVIAQEFPTARLVTNQCELTRADGTVLNLDPMRPNGVVPPSTPPKGVTGVLIDGGSGALSEYPRELPKGAIVVMDYNCRDGWIKAFRLGAQAVIFIRRNPLEAWHFHYSEALANLPRFYFAGDKAELPFGETVTVKSAVTWKPARGRNVIAFLKGTAPTFDEAKGEEVVILAANLDSFGEVPHRAAGARGAANCAALLQIARALKDAPPRRHVVFAFFDAQAYGHLGSTAFYRVIDPTQEEYIDTLSSSLSTEREFLTSLLDMTKLDNPLADKGLKNRDHLRKRLKLRGENHVFDINSELVVWRLLRRRLVDDLPVDFQLYSYRFAVIGKEFSPEDLAKMSLDDIDARIERMSATKKRWNDLRRALTKDAFGEGSKQYWSKKEFFGLAVAFLVASLLGVITAIYGRGSKTFGTVSGIACGILSLTLWIIGISGLEVPKSFGRGPSLISRLTGRQQDEADRKEVRKVLKQGLQEVRDDLQARLAELDSDDAALAAERELSSMLKSRWISLHATIGFGDTTDRWGLVIGGQSDMGNPKDDPGVYTQIQNLFLKSAQQLEEKGAPVKEFETKSADLTLAPANALWANESLVHSGEVAGRLGIYNLVLGTTHENLAREGTPDDTLELLNLERVATQTAGAGRLLATVIDSDALSRSRSIKAEAHYVTTEFVKDRLKGTFVMAAQGGAVPNRPTPDAVVQVRYRPLPRDAFSYSENKLYGFNNFLILMSNQNGMYSYGPGPSGDAKIACGYAAVLDDRGMVVMSSSQASERIVHQRLNVFRCQYGAMVLPGQTQPTATKVLNGITNGPLSPEKSYYNTVDGVTFWFCEENVRSIKLFDPDATVLLNNGPPVLQGDTARTRKQTEEEVKGEGLLLHDRITPMVARRSAVDLWRLDNHRLGILRSKGIKDSSLSALHGRAEDLMAAAEESQAMDEAVASLQSAFFVQRRVYLQIRSMLDDLVVAVLILLALSVPFAFALERLLIGSTTIHKQLGWFAAFFVMTFFLLYITHPAFAVSKTPPVIFLGFAIVVLSGMVIVIIMQKFEVELKVLQGMESTVHAADISRVSTVLAAMSMGISSMRRRPLRTALSAITIILLTFTILCFASFGTETGIIHLFSQPSPDYNGVYIHKFDWKALSADMESLVSGRWGRTSRVCSRYWLTPVQNGKNSVLITRGDGSSPLVLKGVVGISEAELESRPDLARVIDLGGKPMAGQVIMSSVVANDLGVSEGDPVIVQGRRLTLGKPLDPVKISVLRDMDDNSFLPVDFVEQSSVGGGGAKQDAEAEDLAAMESQAWQTVAADECVFVSTSAARSMGAKLHAITIYTEDPAQAQEIAEECARIFPVPIAATRDDGVYKHVLGAKLSASGLKDLFFPILLGGLVIFGTMLGSVADREKEIYTFSALGLAPAHVAGLFFAEAMVYSVIGGLSGYLLAQASMKILGVMATYGLVRVPEMNYSSTNAIITILLVMATVLISALFPAYKASKSANPGVMRSWRVPQPDGDVLSLVFPFTVSEYDITGVVSFLKEHFETHSDTGLGCFMSKQTKLITKGDHVGLRSHLALAPFDLGVTEEFELRSVPSEIEGIDEVAIRLERNSGQPKDWYRLNKVLLDDLRKQFLIWRSLPAETMELYRERTLVEMGQKAPASEPADDANEGNA